MAFILASCDKEEETVLSILPSGGKFFFQGGSNEVINIPFSVNSSTSLEYYEVYEKTPTQSSELIYRDSSLSGLMSSRVFEYQCPALPDTVTVYLTLRVFNQGGEEDEVRLSVLVYPLARLLEESNGHRIYSANSQNTDAFSFQNLQSLYSSSADTNMIDLQDISTSDTLKRTFISQASGEFARVNGFDYANATDMSVVSGYNTSLKASELRGLEVNDVVIYKVIRNNQAQYFLFRLQAIEDQIGSANDYYEFSVKKPRWLEVS